MDILYKFLSHASAQHASTSTPLTPASSEYDSSSAASGSRSTTSSTLDSVSIQDEQDEPRLLVSPAEKFAARVRCARESDFPTLRGKPLVHSTLSLKHKSNSSYTRTTLALTAISRRNSSRPDLPGLCRLSALPDLSPASARTRPVHEPLL